MLGTKPCEPLDFPKEEKMLSFAPDRRSVQGTFFHFSDRGAGHFDRRGFSQLDTLAIALNKIYDENFPSIDKNLTRTLVSNLVTEVPIYHHNLTLLAVANLIVHYMRNREGTNVLTPDLFRRYLNELPPRIVTEATQSASKKSPAELQMAQANFMAALLRYIIYVQNNIPYLQPASGAQGTAS